MKLSNLHETGVQQTLVRMSHDEFAAAKEQMQLFLDITNKKAKETYVISNLGTTALVSLQPEKHSTNEASLVLDRDNRNNAGHWIVLRKTADELVYREMFTDEGEAFVEFLKQVEISNREREE